MQAGAAHDLLLDHRHLLPRRRRIERGRVATRAAADDDDVEVAHARATFCSVSAISAGCGIIASSSGGLVGTGVSFAAIRTTG